MIADALAVAAATITKNRPVLERLIASLLEKETLERPELDTVLASVPDGELPGIAAVPRRVSAG